MECSEWRHIWTKWVQDTLGARASSNIDIRTRKGLGNTQDTNPQPIYKTSTVNQKQIAYKQTLSTKSDHPNAILISRDKDFALCTCTWANVGIVNVQVQLLIYNILDTGHVISYIEYKTLEYIWNVVLRSAAAGSSGGWNLTSYIRHLSHKSLA